MQVDLGNPAYAELGATAREYVLRMTELISQAAASGFGRELSTAFNWFNNGLTFLQKSSGQENVADFIKHQCELADECRDMVVQDVRNSLQIAELTKAELWHWQKRWTRVLIRSTFAHYYGDTAH